MQTGSTLSNGHGRGGATLRRQVAVILIPILASLLGGLALAAGINGDYRGFPIVKVQVNGQVLNPPVPGIGFYGSTLVPVRAVAEALGCEVSWDPENWTAVIKSSQIAAIASPSGGDTTKLKAELETTKAALNAALVRAVSAEALTAIKDARIKELEAELAAIGALGPTQGTTAVTPTTSDVIESYIDGTFEGWTGDTVFALKNGQIWKQVSFSYVYHWAFMPKVLIYKSGSVYKMQVEGVDQTITVERLK